MITWHDFVIFCLMLSVVWTFIDGYNTPGTPGGGISGGLAALFMTYIFPHILMAIGITIFYAGCWLLGFVFF